MRALRACQIVAWAWMFAVLGSPPAGAETVATMPVPAGYVEDYAGVMSETARLHVEALCRQVHDRTRAQIFVVTVHSLEGATVDQFANDLFAKWKIGEAKTDRGVLLLFSIRDRQRRIEVGYGLEGALNDAKAGDIGREMVPMLRQNDYDGAIETGALDVARIIATDTGVALPPLPETVPPTITPPAPAAGFPADELIPFLLIAGIFAFFIYLSAKRVRRGPGGYSSAPDYAPAITPASGFDSAGAGGSGFDSGGSFGSSASDGGFSGGDGGSSGGGGASGDW